MNIKKPVMKIPVIENKTYYRGQGNGTEGYRGTNNVELVILKNPDLNRKYFNQ